MSDKNIKDKAYMKMATNFTKKQRKQWNAIRHEMWLLSDSLNHKVQAALKSTKKTREQIKRLNDLVSQLPVLHEDGKGNSSFGDACNIFDF